MVRSQEYHEMIYDSKWSHVTLNHAVCLLQCTSLVEKSLMLLEAFFRYLQYTLSEMSHAISCF